MIPFYAVTEDFIKSEKTYVATPVSASATPVYVDNNQGYTANDFFVIGTEGDETTEMRQVSSTPSGQLVASAVFSFAHKIDEPIVKYAYNQRKFYGCATSGGTFVLIETKDIEVDNPRGTYFAYTGSTYNYFKATYYNSTTTTESDIDDSTEVQAGDVDHYCSIYEIKEEAGFLNNPYISDGRINLLRLQAENEVKASIASRYLLPLSYVPEIIKTVTQLLSAGRLLYQEYGSETDGLAKDGVSKIKEARSILKAIREGEMILLNASDAELAHSETIGATLAGYPDDTTADAEETDSGGEIRFRQKKEF